MLKKITRKNRLQIRGTQGEKTEVAHQVYDISNRQRLGISESECIKALYKGCTEIIHMESNFPASCP